MRTGKLLFGLNTRVALALMLASAHVAAAQQAPSDASHPARGHTFEANFGERVFKLVFDAAKSDLTFTSASGHSSTVAYTAKEIRAGVYMVYWDEPDRGNMITQVEDFEKGVVYTNQATKDGKFYHLTGTWKQLD